MERGRKAKRTAVYWYRVEMASGQTREGEHRAALAALHDLYLARGVAKAEMITQSDLIRLAQDSVSDAVTGLSDDSEDIEVAP